MGKANSETATGDALASPKAGATSDCADATRVSSRGATALPLKGLPLCVAGRAELALGL
jgi:hypothetical protein